MKPVTIAIVCDKSTHFISKLTDIIITECVLLSIKSFNKDDRVRVCDNIFVESLWRLIKHEEVYLHDYQMVLEVRGDL